MYTVVSGPLENSFPVGEESGCSSLSPVIQVQVRFCKWVLSAVLGMPTNFVGIPDVRRGENLTDHTSQIFATMVLCGS